MEIIDEEGRLFGAINVVDALVVLVVLAVAIAGIALVTGGETTETETRYVTLDLGTQPEFVVDQLEIGDTATLDNEFGNLTITDTYLTRAAAGTQATVRVKVTGRATEGRFTFGGEPLRLSRTLRFENGSYAVNGTITAVGNETTLSTRERTVVLRGTVPDDVARTVEAGDEIRVGGEAVATFQDVAAYDANSPDRRTLYVVATLQTIENGDDVQFGGRPVEVGQSIPLSVAGFQYNGTIERVGSGFDRQTTEVIVSDVVDTDTASAIDAGDTYDVAGQSVATVENVTVYGTDDPDRKRVYAGLSVRTLGYGQQPRLGTRTLEEGATIPFRTDAYDFDGNVVQFGTSDLQVTSTEVLVTTVVDVDIADRLEEGTTYTAAGRPVATIEQLSVYGTDNPNRKRVYVGLSVRALGYSDTLRFGANRSLREGVTLPFRTSSYEFSGEITRVGTLSQPGEVTDRTVTLEMENVPPERADSVEEGLTETNGGQTVARVLDVQVEPAVITLTSESGDIFEREHPVNKDVTLTVELQVREQDSGVQFKGRILQEGDEVILDLGTTTIRASVTELNS